MIIKTTNKPPQDGRDVLEAIASHANKGEIAAWNRKRKAIERIIEVHIRPLEDKLLELNAELIPHYDKLTHMRNEMTEFCVHPIDMLIHIDGYVSCKFCDAKLAVPIKPVHAEMMSPPVSVTTIDE